MGDRLGKQGENGKSCHDEQNAQDNGKIRYLSKVNPPGRHEARYSEMRALLRYQSMFGMSEEKV